MKTIKRYINRTNKIFSKYLYYFKHKDNLFLSKDVYSNLSKYDQNYRGSQKCIFNSHTISFNSPFWFLHSVDEIFVNEVYKFLPDKDQPVIIDCGANIGLSILYFKKISKNSKIIAFEADPLVFKQLENNVSEYNYKNIELINAAVWTCESTIVFTTEGSVGGKINNDQNEIENTVEVPSIRLRDYLTSEIDFLKIDIEGAEYEVLKDCADMLFNVKTLFIEYHVLHNEEQRLHEMLTWVYNAGFKYYIKEAWNNMEYPLMKIVNSGYQMQLNIFCYK